MYSSDKVCNFLIYAIGIQDFIRELNVSLTLIFNQLILELKLKGINDKYCEWKENKIVCLYVYKTKKGEGYNRPDKNMHWNKI